MIVVLQNTNEVLTMFDNYKVESNTRLTTAKAIIGGGDMKTEARKRVKKEEDEDGDGVKPTKRAKLDNAAETPTTSSYFAKYLTSPKLLQLQLNDSQFRRYILVQMLVSLQWLSQTSSKFMWVV